MDAAKALTVLASVMRPFILGQSGPANARKDSWFNVASGLGTDRDQTTAAEFGPEMRIPDQELTWLWSFDDMVRLCINLPVEEMFREGYTVSCDDPAVAREAEEIAKRLDLYGAFQNALIWGRLYGGGILVFGADDGNDPSLPLVEDQIKSVNFFDSYDRRRVTPFGYETDKRAPRYGQPNIFSLQSLSGGITEVHESRMVITRGALTDDITRKAFQGWDWSLLQTLRKPIGHFQEIHASARLLMGKASVGIFTMSGLISLLSGGQQDVIEARAAMLDRGVSIARSILLDKESGEDYKTNNQTFAGVAEQLEAAAERLSGATGIPVIRLLGKTVSGLSTSAESTMRLWYDGTRALQNKIVVPPLVRAYRLIGKSLGYAGPWTVEPKPLWQESPTEKAARMKTHAEIDKTYVEIDVLTPEEVAQARFRKDGWNPETPPPVRHAIAPQTTPPNPSP